MKIKKRKPRPVFLKRKLHIGNEVWTYKMGHRHVVIRHPDGLKSSIANKSQVTGLSWDTIERGEWKRTSDAHVYPRQIKKWIENNLKVK